MFDLLFEISALISGSALIYLLFKDRKKRKKKQQNAFISGSGGSGDKEEIVIELEKLNVLWQERVKAEIFIDQLAKIWRTYEGSENDELDEEIDLKHDLLLEFYIRYLRGRKWFKGKIRNVILEVMKILDEKGDVPSVVRAKNEAYDLDKNTYTLLSRIPLYVHSVNTAEAGLNLGASGIIEPQLVLACLAHDLGKIPEYFAELYTLGDHPIISAAVLDQIPGFKDLPFAEEVRQAIVNHHRTGKGKLVELLKQADRTARRRELSQMMQEKSKKKTGIESKRELKPEENKKVENEAKTTEEKKNISEREPEKEEKIKVSVSDFYQEAFEEKVVYEYDLSWLKIQEFLQELKKEINRVVDGKWIAFSMPDGVVYVHPTGLWAIIKKLALKERIPEVITCEGDKTLKRSILVSLIKILRREGCIEEGLIQEGYFSAPFLVYREDEKEPVRVLYTPFRTEAFGVMPSEFEKLKEGTVLKKITKVEPAYS